MDRHKNIVAALLSASATQLAIQAREAGAEPDADSIYRRQILQQASANLAMSRSLQELGLPAELISAANAEQIDRVADLQPTPKRTRFNVPGSAARTPASTVSPGLGTAASNLGRAPEDQTPELSRRMAQLEQKMEGLSGLEQRVTTSVTTLATQVGRIEDRLTRSIQDQLSRGIKTIATTVEREARRHAPREQHQRPAEHVRINSPQVEVYVGEGVRRPDVAPGIAQRLFDDDEEEEQEPAVQLRDRDQIDREQQDLRDDDIQHLARDLYTIRWSALVPYMQKSKVSRTTRRKEAWYNGTPEEKRKIAKLVATKLIELLTDNGARRPLGGWAKMRTVRQVLSIPNYQDAEDDDEDEFQLDDRTQRRGQRGGGGSGHRSA